MVVVRREVYRCSRRGFTLIEALVALSLTGMVLAGASSILSAISLASDRANDASGQLDHEANAERALRALVLAYEPTADSAASFGGDERRAWFDTWCPTAHGWLEKCSALLAIDSIAGQRAVVAVLSQGGSIAIRTGFAAGALIYLRDVANGGTWLKQWPASLSAPLAIGVVTDADTTILRVGERR